MHKTLEHWLTYLETSHSKTIDLGLDRILKVKEYLNLHLKLKIKNIPIITVAGTNGKGSTCNFLSNILTAAHYNVGLYTSPHLLHFNERICINNKTADDKTIIQAFE